MTIVDDGVRVVVLTAGSAEVRLCAGRGVVSIGKVGSSEGRWFWQHRDGEQSSPVAASRADAANQLVRYHRAFKIRAQAAPERRLLFG